ncbi:MAG: hypothetical protein J6B89_03585 [Bacilli bacterium]|nr:hypothetical protein [Bacilli bacterium]
MNYKIINTGSDGNCTIVNNIIVIDVGVSYKKLAPYINKIKLVFISHCHCDHLNRTTVRKLSENRPTLRFSVGSYLVNELIELGVSKANIDLVEPNTIYDYGIFKISPIKLYHDVPNMGLRLFINDKKLIYATDTCTLEGITAKNYDVYLIEGNYENEEELHERAYNDYYESRVKRTHLSKEQATEWLLENMSENSIYEFMHQHKNR